MSWLSVLRARRRDLRTKDLPSRECTLTPCGFLLSFSPLTNFTAVSWKILFGFLLFLYLDQCLLTSIQVMMRPLSQQVSPWVISVLESVATIAWKFSCAGLEVLTLSYSWNIASFLCQSIIADRVAEAGSHPLSDYVLADDDVTWCSFWPP